MSSTFLFCVMYKFGLPAENDFSWWELGGRTGLYGQTLQPISITKHAHHQLSKLTAKAFVKSSWKNSQNVFSFEKSVSKYFFSCLIALIKLISAITTFIAVFTLLILT